MKNVRLLLGRSVGTWFKNATDPQIIDAINYENVHNLYRFSIIGFIVEVTSLVSFAIANWDSPSFWNTFFNVCCCIIACIVVTGFSKQLRVKYQRTKTISSWQSNTLVSVFYVLLSAWGTMIDTAHYQNGEQMLTFYIVQFCFLCFVVMKPKLGGLLIALAFSSLFLRLYLFDGAASIQPLNFIIFGVIAILGNAIQYMILQESEKNKMQILALNRVLQMEAMIDDLTKLKNRKALNQDMEKYIGRSVFMVMADIDHFKKYNDTYGHLVGDKVLNLVAASIKEIFQEEHAYRYGGDEFLIILVDTAQKACQAQREKWEKAIQAIKMPDVAIPICCSSGYAYGTPRDAQACRDLIKAADDKMYEEKYRKR